MCERSKYHGVARKTKAAVTRHARMFAHMLATLPSVWYERSFDRYALSATETCRTRCLGA